MSTLRISDAPLLPDVDGTEKIPTGGRGDYAISIDQIKGHIFQDIGKELVGLGNVDNTSDLDKPVSAAQQAALNLKADKTYVDTNLDLKADKASVYTRSETSLALSRKADLVNGVIPENQIPSSFNDVLEFTTPNLPIIGESGKIYVTTDTNKTWRWGGNKYVEISGWNPDSVSKKLTVPTYYAKEAGVDPVTGVANSAYFNVRSTDENAMLVEYQNVGGSAVATGKSYPSAAAVAEVASTITEVKDAIIDPITGKVVASKVFDKSGVSQQEVNDKTSLKLYRDNETIYDHGAIGDGTLHTVEEWYTAGSTYYNPKYTNLVSVQANYPFVNNKDFSIDQAAILKLANKRAATGGGTVDLSEGHFILKPIVNNEMVLVPAKVTIAGRGDATIVESITALDDAPNTAVWWDMFLFKGANTVGGGVRDLIVRQTGGRRINAGAIVQRQGANRQKFKNIKFESAIASCIAAEGNVTAEVFTGTVISGCEFRPDGRHGVYLIGSYGNTVIDNIFHVSALESIAVRAFSDNLIENNTFLGVAGVDAHAITLAQPPSGKAYKISNLNIKGNRAFNLRGAFFYGQGNGTQLYDSAVSRNFASQALDYTGTAHVFQFYRTERCDLSGNSIGFARNRAMQLYGCKGNDLSKTTVKNANDVGASVGAIILASYTDPIEGIETHSTGNIFSKCVFIDERTPAKHLYAIQCLSGSNGNIINRNTYIGGGATRINSADGLNKQNLGYGLQLVNFTGVVTGATSPATILNTPLGVSRVYPVSDCYLQNIRMSIGGLVTSGVITAKILLNGATIRQIIFTANNTSSFSETIFQPDQNPVKQTDYIGVTLEHSGVSMSASSLNISIDIVLSE